MFEGTVPGRFRRLKVCARRMAPLAGQIQATLPCAVTLSAALVLFAQPASAREPVRSFAIKAGPLRIALAAYARQSGLQVLFAPELVAGKEAPPLQGRYTRREALEKLLEAHHLIARPLHSGAILILADSAQTAGSPESHPPTKGAPPQAVFEEILVTAFKYPTILADSAADLTVVTGKFQRRRGIDALETLAQATPSLRLAEGNGAAQRLTIRGIYGNGEPTVGVYFGDSPVSGPSGTTFDPGWIAPDLELVDINRVELLRGPQGTLYGASSMGGTLRFLFNTPDMTRSTNEARAGLAFTQDGEPGHHASAIVNLPIVADELALRAVAYDRHTGGYIDQPRYGLSNVGATDRSGARLALGWQPEPDLNLRLSLFHQKTRTDAARFFDDRAGPRINDLQVVAPNSNTLSLASAALDWMTDWGTFTGAATLYRWKVVKQTDFSGVIGRLIDNAASCQRLAGLDAATPCSATQWDQYHGFVQSRLPAILYQPMWVTSANGELRFHTEALAHTALTLGLFAETRRDRVDSNTALANAQTGLLVEPVDVTGLRSIWTGLDQTALFGEASHDLLPDLTATGGFRLFHYFKHAYGEIFTPNLITGTADIEPGRFTTHETGTNLKLQLTWRPLPGLVTYLQMADGFRPGGVNITPSLTAEERTYRADSLRSYEAGLRVVAADTSFELQGALYHIDWSDMIFSANSENNAFVYNTNIGSVAIDGAELNVQWKPLAPFTLSLAASWTDARLARDQERASSLGQLQAGDPVPTIPVLSGSLGLSSEAQVRQNLTGWARLDVIGASGFASQFNTLQSGYARTPGRITMDVALGAEHREWDASLVLRNLLDNRAPAQILANSLGERQLYGATPRTIMLEFARRL